MVDQEDFQIIASLDLDPIKVKLMHEESGEGWTLEQANAVAVEYRRFLYLMKKFPTEQAAPRFDVDVFWHYHILDTMKYAEDCQIVFGHFLHHFPYIGLRGEDDLAAHHRIGQRMGELYEQTFGEPYMSPGAQGAVVATAFSARLDVPATWVGSRPRLSSAIKPGAARTRRGPTIGAVPVAFSAAIVGTAFSAATVRTASPAPPDATLSAGTACPALVAAQLFSVRPALNA